MPAFSPNPDDKLALFGETYVVQKHPEVAWVAYAQEGSRAVTYKLCDARNHEHALKVFRAQFRDARQPEIAAQMARYRLFPGLRAANRKVVAPGGHPEFPDLDHAVVMPWIRGYTWFDLLNRAKVSRKRLRTEVAIHVCRRFLAALQKLEDVDSAHTDIAAGNIVIDLSSFDVQLIDLEELFGPGLVRPAQTMRRTPGYTRDQLASPDGGFWVAEGDRLAGAILAGEILALSDLALAPTAHGDSFFEASSIGDRAAPRFQAVLAYLRALSPEFATLFERAWTASSLAACPAIKELATCVEELAAPVPVPIGEAFTSEPAAPLAPPPPPPFKFVPIGGPEITALTRPPQGTIPIPLPTGPDPELPPPRLFSRELLARLAPNLARPIPLPPASTIPLASPPPPPPAAPSSGPLTASQVSSTSTPPSPPAAPIAPTTPPLAPQAPATTPRASSPFRRPSTPPPPRRWPPPPHVLPAARSPARDARAAHAAWRRIAVRVCVAAFFVGVIAVVVLGMIVASR